MNFCYKESHLRHCSNPRSDSISSVTQKGVLSSLSLWRVILRKSSVVECSPKNFFFLLRFSFTNTHNSQDIKGREAISHSSLPLQPASKTLIHQPDDYRIQKLVGQYFLGVRDLDFKGWLYIYRALQKYIFKNILQKYIQVISLGLAIFESSFSVVIQLQADLLGIWIIYEFSETYLIFFCF